MYPVETRRLALVLAGAIVLVFVVFGAWPMIDLTVSGWFHRPGAGFPVSRIALAEFLRNTIWNLSLGFAILAAAMLLVARATDRKAMAAPASVWAYILALFLLAPGLLVNVVLKSHWGRARPADVLEFGGSATFTPAYQITDQCAKNCSFVSGEVSASVALAISVWALTRGMERQRRRKVLCIAFALPALSTLQRVAAGRHFLSDALLAALFTCLIAVALAPLLRGRS